jgi:hypothetical protein
METKARKGTLSDAIDAVSTFDIIEEFGIPNKTRRGRTYLLCPGHDDKNFGSCYVDKNGDGYYCYVCGQHVKKWNMVLMLNGNKKADAYEWFFRMAGISPAEEKHDDPYKKALHLIRKLEQYLRNNVVYNDVCVCDKTDSSYGRNINGEYLYSEVAIANPLMELYKKDKTAFKKVVERCLDAEIKKIQKARHTYEHDFDECLYVDGVGLVPYNELADACKTMINELNALSVEAEKL